MTETLTGSTNSYSTFLVTPEIALIGVEQKRFTLIKPRQVGGWRPGAFYHISPTMKRWKETLIPFKDRSEKPAPQGSPPDSALLVLRDRESKLDLQLLVGREDGVLYQCESYFDKKLLTRMTVSEFERGPGGRLFPKHAEILVYGPNAQKGLPSRVQTLTAGTISFPASRLDTDKAFAFDLPTGTVISDEVLNRAIVLERSTPVTTVVYGSLPARDFTTATDPPENEQVAQNAQGRSRQFVWGIGLALLAISIALLWFGIQRRYRR